MRSEDAAQQVKNAFQDTAFYVSLYRPSSGDFVTTA